MRNITTVLVHPSGVFAEGLKRVLEGTPFKLTWYPDLPASLPAKVTKAKREQLFIVSQPESDASCSTVGNVIAQNPDSRVIVIGVNLTANAVLEALRMGASGYLEEAMSCETLVKTLDLVMRGETVLPTRILKALPGGIDTAKVAVVEAGTVRHEPAGTAPAASPASVGRDAAPKARPGVNSPPLQRPARAELPALQPVGKHGVLSVREAEILRCLLGGASNKEIARKLEMAEATVKVHLKAILRKIQAKNRTQAAIWAVNHLGQRNGAAPGRAELANGEYTEKPSQRRN